MSKKLLSLILCLSMLVLPVLTACGNKGDKAEEDVADAATDVVRDPMTLSLWLPTSSETTKESIKQVEAALNILLTAKYNTKIELNAVSEDKYASVIDDKIISIDDEIKAAEAAAEAERLQLIEYAKDCVLPSEREGSKDNNKNETTAANKDEKPAESEGAAKEPEVVFPEVAADQLDIFLVKGYDSYLSYIEKGLVKTVEDEISAVAGKLYSYIYPSFFDLARVNGSLYCVPNSHALGEYEFLLVNKEYANMLNYSEEELSTIIDCEEFIVDFANQNVAGVTPLLGECEAANMVYFGTKDGSWSLVGQQITAGTTANSKLPPRKTFDITAFVDTYGMMKRLKAKGLVGDGVIDEGEKFAVGVVKGDISIKEQYSDEYYVYTHAVPVADTDDVFESVFCISEYTKDSTRAMEVINFINTNEDFRTILQYGVENVHWKLDDSGDEDVIRILDDSYKMNIVDTGNVFITYPEAGVPKSGWKNAMLQNKESATNPYNGFTYDVYVTDDTKDMFARIESLSKNYIDRLEKATAEEYDSVKNSIIQEIGKNSLLNTFLASEVPEELPDGLSEIFIQTYDMYYSSKS